eukprot:GGOE01020195.1.p1 GENE.GGOE01020195.1~~GGOE01020195.1.p1  ORF type:complete len:163 (-),score=1.74 GGOE01020195.1:241-729(-)
MLGLGRCSAFLLSLQPAGQLPSVVALVVCTGIVFGRCPVQAPSPFSVPATNRLPSWCSLRLLWCSLPPPQCSKELRRPSQATRHIPFVSGISCPERMRGGRLHSVVRTNSPSTHHFRFGCMTMALGPLPSPPQLLHPRATLRFVGGPPTTTEGRTLTEAPLC